MTLTPAALCEETASLLAAGPDHGRYWNPLGNPLEWRQPRVDTEPAVFCYLIDLSELTTLLSHSVALQDKTAQLKELTAVWFPTE
jgi:hypothetical protein